MYHMFCCVTHFVVRFQVANPFYAYTYYIKMREYILSKFSYANFCIPNNTVSHPRDVRTLRNTVVRTPNLAKSETLYSSKKISRKRFCWRFAGNRIYNLILEYNEENNNFYEIETSLEITALCYQLFLQLHSLLSFAGFFKCTQTKYISMPAKLYG